MFVIYVYYLLLIHFVVVFFFFSSRRRHTRCALVTGVQTCALPIYTAFLRSMIPHHSGAILMCEQASLKDAQIRELCRGIIAGQAAEIEQIKTILARK